jgi:hypothetical protein
MGISAPLGPLSWSPRAILKVREVKKAEFEKCQLELLILRQDVDYDWDVLNREIWVKIF